MLLNCTSWNHRHHQSCSDCIIATRGYDFREGQGHGVIAVGVPLDPIDQACFLNSSTRTRVFSL
jgi:hypothetical protein